MRRMILGRLAAGVLTLLVASALIFAATQLLPGDVATAALGRDATPQAVAQLRQQLGLNRPAIVRYGSWLGGIIRGDLGKSAINGVPVTQLIGQRLLNSLLLVAATLTLRIPLALVFGTATAVKRRARL